MENKRHLLFQKAINLHYAKKYLNFIERFENTGGKIKHHFLPKSKDFWFEYKDLKENIWNCVLLTDRQHFIAHCLLAKALGGSQISAFWRMSKGNSKQYQDLREKFVKQHSSFMKKMYEENGTKNKSEENKRRVKNGTHNWLKKKNDDPFYFEQREANRKKSVLEKYNQEPLIFSKRQFLEKNGVQNVSQILEVKQKNKETNRMKIEREVVKQIKSYHKRFNLKLKQSWWKKDDDTLLLILEDYQTKYGTI
jgi:hypothetical protein